MRLMIRFIPLVCEKQNWRLRWFCRWQIWNLVWLRQFWAQLKVSVTSDCSYLLLRSSEFFFSIVEILESATLVNCIIQSVWTILCGISGVFRFASVPFSKSETFFADKQSKIIKKNSQYNSIFWISLFHLVALDCVAWQ